MATKKRVILAAFLVGLGLVGCATVLPDEDRRAYVITWNGPTTGTWMQVRCGRRSGDYTRITTQPAAAVVRFPVNVIVGTEPGPWYCRTYPIIGRTVGTPNTEMMIVISAPSEGGR